MLSPRLLSIVTIKLAANFIMMLPHRKLGSPIITILSFSESRTFTQNVLRNFVDNDLNVR